MSVKLSASQQRVLKRLNVGAYYPGGRDIQTSRILEKKGFAVGNSYGAWSITVEGRAALDQGVGE